MPDYKLKNGKVISEDQLIKLAKKRGTTINEIISKNGLEAVTPREVKSKDDVPGAVASSQKNIAPSTVSGSVDGSSAFTSADPFGFQAIQDQLDTDISGNKVQSSRPVYVKKEKVKIPKQSLVYKDTIIDLSNDIDLTSSNSANSIVDYYKNILEKDGFEVRNTPSTIFIKSPNGQSTSFNVTTGFARFENLNNWLKENSKDEDLQAFKDNKKYRNQFLSRVKSLINQGPNSYRDGLENEETRLETIKEIKQVALNSFNEYNKNLGEDPLFEITFLDNQYGFRGTKASEVTGLTDYQQDILMNNAVDQFLFQQQEENQQVELENFSNYIENKDISVEEYFERARKNGINLLDKDLKQLGELNDNIIQVSNQLKNTPYTDNNRQSLELKLKNLKKVSNSLINEFLGKDAGFFLNIDTKYVSKEKGSVDSNNTINITNNVKSVIDQLLTMKETDFGSLEVAYGLHRKETDDLNKILNKKVNVSDTRDNPILSEGWLNALKRKYDMNANEFKNLTIRDLVDIYISSKGFMMKDFGDGLKAVPTDVKESDKDAVYEIFDEKNIKELTQRYLNLKSEKQAFDFVYLANINPKDIQRTGFFTTFGRGVAASFTSKEKIQANWDPTSSEVLTAIEEIGQEANINFTESQIQNFKQTSKEFVGETLSAAPRLAIEFGIANVVTGGLSNITGLTRLGLVLKNGKYFKNVYSPKLGKMIQKPISYAEVQAKAASAGYRMASGRQAAIGSKTVQNFVKSQSKLNKSGSIVKKGGSVLDRGYELGISSVIEGIKMEAIFGDGGFETGMAFIPASRITNVAFKKILGGSFFKGTAYHRLNELVFKPFKSGVSLVPASEMASALEAVAEDFTGGEDFKTYFEENFSQLPMFGENSVSRRLLGHFITGLALGYPHAKLKNITQTLNNAKSMRAEARKNAEAIIKENGANPKDVKTAKDLEAYKAAWNMANDYIVAAEIAAIEVTPELLAKQAQTDYNNIVEKYKKETGKNLNISLKIQMDGRGLNGKNAEYIPTSDGKGGTKYDIVVDARKYQSGIIPHEIGHVFAEIYGLNSKESLQKIRKFIEPLVKKNIGRDIFREIQEKYKNRQSSETFEEEYLMQLVELLGKGGDGLIRNNVYGNIKNKLNSLFNKNSDLKLQVDTPEQLLNIIANLAKGSNIQRTWASLGGLMIKGPNGYEQIFSVSEKARVGDIKGQSTVNRLGQLEARQNELSDKGELTNKESLEFESNVAEINELLSGKKSSLDIETKLEELEDKYLDGIIDFDDYEQQKRNIIDKSKRTSVTTTKPKDEKQKTTKVLESGRTNEDLVDVIKSEQSTAAEKQKATEELQNSFGELALTAIKFDTRKGGIDREEAKQELISTYLPRIIELYDPKKDKDGNATQKFSTYAFSSARFKAQDVYEKLKVTKAKSLDVEAGETGSVKEIAGTDSADKLITESEGFEERIQKDIDPTRDLKTIELERLDRVLKIDKDIVQNVTPEYIEKNFVGDVGQIITGIPAAKIVGTNKNFSEVDFIGNPSTGKKLKPGETGGVKFYSDKTKALNYFDKGNNLERHIKTLPEFNVSRSEAGEVPTEFQMLVSKDVRGRSVLKAKLFKDYFYEPFIDPKAKSTKVIEGSGNEMGKPFIEKDFAISSGSGRSKGLTSQTGVVRLKPQFRGRISPETISAVRKYMETSSVEFIKANIKIVAQNLANKLARNKIESLKPKVDANIDQILVDIKSATSSRLASFDTDKLKYFLEYNGIQSGTVKELMKVARDENTIKKGIEIMLDDSVVSSVIAQEHGLNVQSKDLFVKLSDKSQGTQKFSLEAIEDFRTTQAEFASFLPKKLSENRTLIGFILGRHYRNDLTNYNYIGEPNASKKVFKKKGSEIYGEEATRDEIYKNKIHTDLLNIYLDSQVDTSLYSKNTKDLIKQLKEKIGDKKLQAISSSRNKTLRKNLKGVSSLKQKEIIKKAATDKKNNDARSIALNLINSLKIDFVNSTPKGSKERLAALRYMVQLAGSTSSIHYGEKALAKIVGGVTGRGEYYLEHLDTATQSTGIKALDNILLNKNTFIESRAMLVPKSFRKILDSSMASSTSVGILRLLAPGVRSKIRSGQVFIVNNKNKLVDFKNYVENPNTWVLDDALAVDKVVRDAKFSIDLERNLEDMKKFDVFEMRDVVSSALFEVSDYFKLNFEQKKAVQQEMVNHNLTFFKDGTKASIDINKEFNDIIERKTGISSSSEISPVRAQLMGKGKGRFDFFIAPGAEDFLGLLYKTVGKGKQGDKDLTFYKRNLIDPYARGVDAITKERRSITKDYKIIKEQLGIVPKNLRKELGTTGFTKEQGVRTYIWAKQGMDIPGLSKGDFKTILQEFNKNPDLIKFANKLIQINKGDAYAKPSNNWLTGSITTDLLEGLNTTKRSKYLQKWQDNVDIIFSEQNLNKLQAAYGIKYRKALENMLLRMKTGRNRTYGTDTYTARLSDWLNGSVGAVMFFNTRSAVLQTLSATNFINLSDNNIFKAGKAFANQPQYWKDFKDLFNSDFLVDRRSGLKINVNEADIANMAKKGGVRGVINGLLKFGFTPTQLADSFAIASGGATFYRNRIKTYEKQKDVDGNLLYTKQEAANKAFKDFRELAEVSQQSSRPDMISQQQAGPLGRLVLAFANTPSQYARIIKKAALDLKNGRGDAKSNISKIVYYTFAQNVLFNALQQALFAVAFGDDEGVTDDKTINMANGMANSLLRGMGMYGAITSGVKDAAIKIYTESKKDRPEYEKAATTLLNISPPLSSKYRKVAGGLKEFSFTSKSDIIEKGFSIDNPAISGSLRVTEGVTNIPVDRLLTKVENINAALQEDVEYWERVSLLLGWQDWQLGMKEEKQTKKKKTNKFKRSRLKKVKF